MRLRRTVAIRNASETGALQFHADLLPGSARRLWRVHGYRLNCLTPNVDLVANAMGYAGASLVVSAAQHVAGLAFIVGPTQPQGPPLHPSWVVDIIPAFTLADITTSGGGFLQLWVSGGWVPTDLVVPQLYLRLDIEYGGFSAAAMALATVEAQPFEASLEEMVKVYKVWGLDAKDFTEMNPS